MKMVQNVPICAITAFSYIIWDIAKGKYEIDAAKLSIPTCI
jgi:hypothetical protein